MANADTSAQHYLECEDCEERPSKFLCKTCSGHLCETCREEHKMKKLTCDHVVVPLTSNNLTIDENMYCPEHRIKKLEYYCIPCEKFVCTKCIGVFHSDHATKSLTTERRQYGDDEERLGRHVRDALRLVETVFEIALQPAGNEITPERMPNRSTTCILQ